MTESSTSKDRRAQLAAGVGFIFQTVFFATLLVVGLVYNSGVILAAARWMLGGVLIWPVLAIVYSQRRRTEEERLEALELKRSHAEDASGGIFDTEDEAYLIERRRLRWILRWMVPGTAILLAAYHLAGSFLYWPWSLGVSLDKVIPSRTESPGIAMAFVGGVGFLSFLYSRYTAGMARTPGWRMLRSGASYLAGNALACLVVLIAMGVNGRDFPNPEALATYAIRIVFLVLGFEFVANYILDFYRPRTAGQESRPAFDSRLLALITEPGGLARSLADAINYQFGFEVSGTWFYQLLKRAALPMLAFGMVSLFALSSVVIVDADERAVVERFGLRLQEPGEELQPGLHFKAPWPMDIAYRVRADQVRSLVVGNMPTDEEYDVVDGKKRLKPILWGEKHEFNQEMMLVLAGKKDERHRGQSNEGIESDEAVGAGLLMVSVSVQYCVDDVFSYLYQYQNPEKMVESITYEVLTDYAAGVTVNQFLGQGRTEVNKALASVLHSRMMELGLGIRILYVALQEAHPTEDVAKTFQDVVKAERERENALRNARGLAEKILTLATGSSVRARALDEAIQKRDLLAQGTAAQETATQETAASREARTEAESRVVELLEGGVGPDGIPAAGGGAAKLLAVARTSALKDLTLAKRNRTLFEAERVAFNAAPRLYRVRKYLEMLQRAVVDIRKYVVVTDPDTNIIVEFEKQEQTTIDLNTK